MRDSIMLTGGTGSLGALILRQLLAKGYDVICLVRGSNQSHAQGRVRALVGEHKNIKVIRGDITEPRCGISDLDREILKRQVNRIFHCAASISFQDRQATQAANVDGIQHILELADILDVRHIAHVSTAYVAGDSHVFDESDVASSIIGQPRNGYEESKQIGEIMLRGWAFKRNDRRITILRPSILIGCEDGTTPTFDAYYGYFKPVYRIAESLRKRSGGGKDLPSGVSVKHQWVNVPLAFECLPQATLNLVPIDWVAEMMVNLLEAPLRNQTFHLVNPEPPLVAWVIKTSLAILKVNGVSIVSPHDKGWVVGAQTLMVKRLQRQLDAVLDQYRPYTCHEITFGMDETVWTLGARYRSPRKLNDRYLAQLLDYALATQWGDRSKLVVPA